MNSLTTHKSDYIFYNSIDLFYKNSNLYEEIKDRIPGIEVFNLFYKLTQFNAALDDRTGTLVLPVKTHTLPFLKVPEMRSFSKSLSEVYVDRAKWLFNHAVSTNRKLVISYSGGIDSTVILISLLMSYSKKELKENVIILISDWSIFESRYFYEKYIFGNFYIDLSQKMNNYIGDNKYVYVTGEGNDQLMGAGLCPKYFISRSIKKAHEELDKDDILAFFYEVATKTQLKDKSFDSKLYNDLISVMTLWDNLIQSSPIPINNAYKYFWWMNFVLRFQAVYTRIFSTITDKKDLVLEDNYFMFYSSEEMQLWVLNNPDNLCPGGFIEYKKPSKDFIFDFTKDEVYNKLKCKIGSLSSLFSANKTTFCIDKDLNYYNEFPGYDMFNITNSFGKL